MYDGLTTRYTFACPERGDTRVSLSSFRRLERLPGTAHPALYRVDFECRCGAEHAGLVTHDELDLAPLGLGADVSFLNLMTDRLEAVELELAELAAARIGAVSGPGASSATPRTRPDRSFRPRLRCLRPPTAPWAWPCAARHATGPRSTSSPSPMSTFRSTTTRRSASSSTCSRPTPRTPSKSSPRSSIPRALTPAGSPSNNFRR